MVASLFPEEKYGSDFDAEWRTYRGPRSSSKRDAYKAYCQTKAIRPPHDLTMLCIEEYLSDIRKTKQAQAHMATWYRQQRWEGYICDAQYRLDNPVPKATARRAFKLSDHPDPLTRPTRTAAEIIAAHRAMKGLAP